MTDPLTQVLLAAERAAHWHVAQRRKGTAQEPYVNHLLEVARLVSQASGGGDPNLVIAALLHDAIEDQGDRTSLSELRDRFGPAVADIVEACSDTDQRPKPPWLGRKQAYIERMQTAPEPVLRVACADKVHNVRSTLADLRAHGERTWRKFGSSPEQQLWYYTTLSELFSRRLPGPLSDELARLVAELTEVAERAGSV